MVLVRKGNVELTVKDDVVQTYLNQGYNIIDTSGNIVKKGIPNDVTSLKLELAYAHKRIKELEYNNEQLNKQIAELKEQNKPKKQVQKVKW